MSESQPQRAGRPVEAVVIFGVVLAGLYLLRDILIPIVLATLFAFLLAPLVRGIQRVGLPRMAAVSVAVTATVALVGCGTWLVTAQAVELGQQFSTYRHSLVGKARALRESISSSMQPVSEAISDIHDELAQPTSRPATANAGATPADASAIIVAAPSASDPTPKVVAVQTTTPPTDAPPSDAAMQWARTVLPTVLHPVAVLGLTAVLAFFFLVYREDLRDRIIRVCGSDRIGLTTRMLTDAGGRFSSYFAGVVLVNALTGAVIALGLLFLGVPNALLFGMLTAILRFIPFLGPWISAIFPLALAVAIFDSWTVPVSIAILFLLVEAGGANLIEPWVYGARVGASSTAILVSMIFWTWIWGPVGLLLATPIVVCLVVIGKYVPRLQFLYVLLGNEPVLEPRARFYQRLLAVEPDGAIAVFREAAGSDPPEKTFSEIVAPALSLLAAEESHTNERSPRQIAAQQAVERLLATVAPAMGRGDDAENRHAPALLPVKGWPDELSADLLTRLIESRGGRVKRSSPRLLISESVEWLRNEQPSAVCLITVSAGEIRRLELLCKRIRDAGIDVPLLISVCNPAIEPHRLEQRFARLPHTWLCRTLVESLDEFEALRRRQPAPGAMKRVSDDERGTTTTPGVPAAGSPAG